MGKIRFQKSVAAPQCAVPQASISYERAVTRPYSYAMEQLRAGDEFGKQGRWFEAKVHYLEAVSTLEKMPIADQRSLKTGLRRLAHTHLVLLELPEAFICLLRARKSERSADPLYKEKQALMERIKSARKESFRSDDDYNPGLYTGHL